MCDCVLLLEKLGAAGQALTDLKQLFSLAEQYGYSEWIQFDASVVRGLAYYTGIVFEVRFLENSNKNCLISALMNSLKLFILLFQYSFQPVRS